MLDKASTHLLAKNGVNKDEFTSMLEMTQVLSPAMVILDGGMSRLGTTAEMSLVSMTNPLSSDLGVVKPAAGVTRALEVTRVVCHVSVSWVHHLM